MKVSKFRTILLLLVLAIACGAAFFTVQESLWPDPSLDAQLQRLQSMLAFRRRAAAANLGRFTSDADRVAPELVKALKDPDREVRANAVRSLKAIDRIPPGAAPVLVDVFQHDRDSQFRQDVASLLGLSKDPAAAAALAEAVDDPDSGVRLAAINALNLSEALGRPGASVDKMVKLLDVSQPEEIRLAAVQALGAVVRSQEPVARLMTEVLAKDPSAFVRNSAALLVRNTRFGFELPALIAAMDDQSPQVRITAGAGVAAVGLSDDRPVPALCRAARKADEMTREGAGANIGMLRFDAPPEGSSIEEATRRFQAAVRELISLVDHKDSAGREQALTVLARVAASYQQSGSPALLEPAKEAIAAVLARVRDENEETSLRVHAMNLWAAVQPSQTPPLAGRRAAENSSASGDQLHGRAAWVGVLGKSLSSPAEPVRSRAVVLLVEGLKNPHAEDWYREAWRKAVPDLIKATASDDNRVRVGAIAILGLLGPEAVAALDALKALTRDSRDAGLRKEAERVLRSVSVKEGLTSRDPAARIAAAETIGGLGWRAASVLPALVATVKDPDPKVRLAAVSALRSLGQEGQPAVTTLATALPAETDTALRVAILEVLEVIAPGTRAVLDAHLNLLHDPDPQVRKAAASFQKVPADESLVSALGKALGDASDQVRLAAAGSLSQIMFENPTVIPALVRAMGNEAHRQAVLQTVDEHLEKVSDRGDFARVRGNLPGLQATLGQAIPALRDALNLKNDEVTIRVYNLLGRIVGFARLGRDPNFQKAIAPVLDTYLLGLESSNPDVLEEVLSGLETVPIHRAEIVSALLRYLQRSDQSEENHQIALHDLAVHSSSAASDPGVRDALKTAMPMLLKSLESPASEARQAAIEILGRLGNDAKPAEETIRRLGKNDPEAKVRKAAENALQAINGVAQKPPTGG